MRITHGVMVNSFLTDMNTNLNSMSKIQKQLNSGKLFSKPSDNPFKVARSMQLYSEINANKQYNTNIKDTINWLDTTDTALKQATESLQRIRELMVSAGNASYGGGELSAIKDEINERVAEVGQILNTTFDGKYIFGGKDGTTMPIEITNVGGQNQIKINGTSINIGEGLNVEISSGVVVEYNANAEELTTYKDDAGNTKSVTDLFNDILNNLEAGNKDEVIQKNLGEIDKVINNMLSIRSRCGTTQNRMESAKELNEAQNFNMTDILSTNEDVDFVEKSMEMAVAQTVYMAALQTSAKVLQPSLLSYL